MVARRPPDRLRRRPALRHRRRRLKPASCLRRQRQRRRTRIPLLVTRRNENRLLQHHARAERILRRGGLDNQPGRHRKEAPLGLRLLRHELCPADLVTRRTKARIRYEMGARHLRDRPRRKQPPQDQQRLHLRTQLATASVTDHVQRDYHCPSRSSKSPPQQYPRRHPRLQRRDTLAALVASLVLAVATGLALSAATATPASGGTPCATKVINDWFDDGTVDGTYPKHC